MPGLPTTPDGGDGLPSPDDLPVFDAMTRAADVATELYDALKDLHEVALVEIGQNQPIVIAAGKALAQAREAL